MVQKIHPRAVIWVLGSTLRLVTCQKKNADLAVQYEDAHDVVNSLYTSFWLHGVTSFIKNAIVKQPLLKTRMVIGPQTGCSDHRLALVQLGQFCSGLDPLCVNQIVFWMLFKVIMDLWFSSQAQKASFFGPKNSVKRGGWCLVSGCSSIKIKRTARDKNNFIYS